MTPISRLISAAVAPRVALWVAMLMRQIEERGTADATTRWELLRRSMERASRKGTER